MSTPDPLFDALSDALPDFIAGQEIAVIAARLRDAGVEMGLDVERLARALDGWFTDGDERWRLVPMTEDGGLSVTSPASWFAEAIAREYAAARVKP